LEKKINMHRKKKERTRRGQTQYWKLRRFEKRIYNHRAHFLAEINISCKMNLLVYL
jgi:hypothetical protein